MHVFKTVKKTGLTSFEIRCKDSCDLITKNRVIDKLIDSNTLRNLFYIS